MSPLTWTPVETSDSSLWSQLQQLSKIAALSKMTSHPSVDRGPSLPIVLLGSRRTAGARPGWAGFWGSFPQEQGCGPFFDS